MGVGGGGGGERSCFCTLYDLKRTVVLHLITP